jgi:hypothetical protein
MEYSINWRLRKHINKCPYILNSDDDYIVFEEHDINRDGSNLSAGFSPIPDILSCRHLEI